MIAESIKAAANPSSRGIGFKALNSMSKSEFVKFFNSSRGVSWEVWEVSGVMPRDTLIEVLNYLKNLILHNKYKCLTSFMGFDVSLTDLMNPRLGANAAPDLTGPNPSWFGRAPHPRPDAEFAPTARTLRRSPCLPSRRSSAVVPPVAQAAPSLHSILVPPPDMRLPPPTAPSPAARCRFAPAATTAAAFAISDSAPGSTASPTMPAASGSSTTKEYAAMPGPTPRMFMAACSQR